MAETDDVQEPAVVKQAVRFKAYPNATQARKLRGWIGCCRALWNHLLSVQKAAYEADKRFLSAKQLDQERQRWEKEADWRRAAPSQTRQRVVTDLDRALRDFFKSRSGKRSGKRLGFPRFKKWSPSGTAYLANTRFEVAEGKLRIDKLGAIGLRGGREISGKVLGARIRLDVGSWFVAVQCEAPPPRVYGDPSTDMLGIDVGLKAAVARSDGVITTAPRHLRKAEKRLRRLQRRLSASQRDSRRRTAKARAVARLHARIRDRRQDFLHVRSARAVGKGAAVCIESLNVAGMARGRFAKSVADAAMSELHRQIEYKAGWSGRRLIRADRYEPTSRTCSSCGQLHDMPLRKRMMRCDCGLEIDRDLNAARNLARIGRERVAEVIGEPVHDGPTDVESGVQAVASAAQPVPLAEASRARRRPSRVSPGIPTVSGMRVASVSRGAGP
jgi:putative transposase